MRSKYATRWAKIDVLKNQWDHMLTHFIKINRKKKSDDIKNFILAIKTIPEDIRTFALKKFIARAQEKHSIAFF